MSIRLKTAQSCQTEKLLKDLRKTPLFVQLIPQEAGISLPIPLRRNEKVYAVLLCFGYKPIEKGKNILFPPFAKLTIQWSNQKPVEYVNLKFNNPAPELQWSGEIGRYPCDTVAAMTYGKYKEKRKDLLQMYDEMFETLQSSKSLPLEWKQQFSDLLSTLIEPPLIPYYQIYGLQFIEKFLKQGLKNNL